MSNRLLRLSAAALFAGVLASHAAIAQEQESSLGERLYSENCAVCHGTNAKGAGEFGKFLTVVPPDLTNLSKDNDGVFPVLDVIRIIDGRRTVQGHSGGDMPIWGNTFNVMAIGQLGEPTDRELLVKMRTTALADYLEELQEQ